MKTSTFICTLVLVLFSVAGLLPFFKHYEFTRNEAVVCKCICGDCRAKEKAEGGVTSQGLSALKAVQEANEWEKGEFVTFRKSLPHAGCTGQMIFNGQAKPAPYSEREQFYVHVCDKCSATNQILNATWPKYKQEWRSL